MTNMAFGLIDAQRGFMPTQEGERLEQEGFGELPIAGGEQIVPAVKKLIGEFALRGRGIFTTQDWHPRKTAHFAEKPNFTTTWPRHCVAGTPGAKLHPRIGLPSRADRFYKGLEKLEDVTNDTSYSGYNALRFSDKQPLPEWLVKQDIQEVVLGGLALDYCVGKTALDIKNKTNVGVAVVLDATAPVTPQTGQEMIKQLEANGVNITTSAEVIARLNGKEG